MLSESSKREPLRSKIADWVTIVSVGQLVVKYFIAYIEVEFLMKYFHIWPEILAAITVAVFIFSKIYFRKTATPQSPTVSTTIAAVPVPPAPVPQPQPAPVPANSPYERRNDTNILELRKDFPVCEAAAKSAGISPKLLRMNNNRSRIFPDPKVPPTKMEKYEAFMNLLIDAIKGGIINPVAAMIPGLLDSYILKKEDITSFYKNHVPEINDAFFNPISKRTNEAVFTKAEAALTAARKT